MRRTLVAAVLALAACATNSAQGPTPHEASASEPSDPDMVCKVEAPTGTAMSRQVCRTPEQIEREHQEAEDLARSRGREPRRRR
jgi:uncharacterized lipoprotein YbaY